MLPVGSDSQYEKSIFTIFATARCPQLFISFANFSHTTQKSHGKVGNVLNFHVYIWHFSMLLRGYETVKFNKYLMDQQQKEKKKRNDREL